MILEQVKLLQLVDQAEFQVQMADSGHHFHSLQKAVTEGIQKFWLQINGKALVAAF